MSTPSTPQSEQGKMMGENKRSAIANFEIDIGLIGAWVARQLARALDDQLLELGAVRREQAPRADILLLHLGATLMRFLAWQRARRALPVAVRHQLAVLLPARGEPPALGLLTAIPDKEHSQINSRDYLRSSQQGSLSSRRARRRAAAARSFR